MKSDWIDKNRQNRSFWLLINCSIRVVDSNPRHALIVWIFLRQEKCMDTYTSSSHSTGKHFKLVETMTYILSLSLCFHPTFLVRSFVALLPATLLALYIYSIRTMDEWKNHKRLVILALLFEFFVNRTHSHRRTSIYIHIYINIAFYHIDYCGIVEPCFTWITYKCCHSGEWLASLLFLSLSSSSSTIELIMYCAPSIITRTMCSYASVWVNQCKKERGRGKLWLCELYVRLCQRVVISILSLFPVRKLSIVHLFNNYTNVLVSFVLFNNCMCLCQSMFGSPIESFIFIYFASISFCCVFLLFLLYEQINSIAFPRYVSLFQICYLCHRTAKTIDWKKNVCFFFFPVFPEISLSLSLLYQVPQSVKMLQTFRKRIWVCGISDGGWGLEYG